MYTISGGRLPLGGEPLTAHPHVDSASDRLVAFSLSVRPNPISGDLRTTITVREFDREWNVKAERDLEMEVRGTRRRNERLDVCVSLHCNGTLSLSLCRSVGGLID